MELGFRISIVSGIPDSLSCIPDSKAQDSGFHKQRFPGLRSQEFHTWGEKAAVTKLVNCIFFFFPFRNLPSYLRERIQHCSASICPPRNSVRPVTVDGSHQKGPGMKYSIPLSPNSDQNQYQYVIKRTGYEN